MARTHTTPEHLFVHSFTHFKRSFTHLAVYKDFNTSEKDCARIDYLGKLNAMLCVLVIGGAVGGGGAVAAVTSATRITLLLCAIRVRHTASDSSIR